MLWCDDIPTFISVVVSERLDVSLDSRYAGRVSEVTIPAGPRGGEVG